MSSRREKRKPHWVRTAFRWFRIAMLLAVCLGVAAVLWCNILGVPGFIGGAIRKEIQRRGIELEFASLRLKGVRHLVARDVRVRMGATNAPVFTVREAEFIVDYERLKSGQFEVSGIRLNAGQLNLPLDEAGTKSLLVTNIFTDVYFVPGDVVRVLDFSAEALGAKTRVTGEVKHLGKFRFASSGGAGTNDWQRHLSEVIALAEQLHFEKAPELTITLNVDGADLTSTRATVMIKSEEATSKWGTFDRLQLSSSIGPTSSTDVRGDFLSEIGGFRTQYGSVDLLRVKGETFWTANMDRLITNHVEIQSDGVNARWFRLSSGTATLTSTQANTNTLIASTLRVTTGQSETSWARAGTNSVEASMTHPLPFPSPAAWLAKLVSGVPAEKVQRNEVTGNWQLASAAVRAGPAELGSVQVWGDLRTAARAEAPESLVLRLETPWRMAATNIRAGEIEIGSVQGSGLWSFPELSVTNLDAHLYGGYLRGAAELNVETRRASARMESEFPYEKLSTLLDAPVQRWFEQFEWENPPFVEARAMVQLPPWTNVWKTADLAKTLGIKGRFAGSGKFRGIPAEKAESQFSFTNFIWVLPDLTITRPEGEAKLHYVGNVTNGEFRCEIDSRIDPGIIKTAFPKEQQAVLGVVKFVQSPHLVAKASGDWDDNSKLGVTASIVATNFFVKEQAFSDIRADILITNGLIHVSDLVVHRGKEEARAPYLRVDLADGTMFVTNIVSTMDPYIAMSLVGEDAYKAIDPYRFAKVPTVRVNGIVPLRHWSKADLRFEVAGNDFSFWRFRMPNLVGDVHWKADHISFSNVTANFYGGKARWSGYFIIDHRDDTANYSFSATTTNTQMKYLLVDLTGKTNHIEGILDGELIINSANSGNDRSWNGFGSATISDGFLWNVPVFGIFSPVLDGIAPGLGTSRVTSGGGTFTLTNSVVYTRDMQVRAPAFRLGYKGQVDLDGNLYATVEAQIFRDAWIVGKLFSIALWPVSKAFEAKVTGTVEAPKTDLRFVPKFLLAPFRALNALGARNGGNEEAVPQTAE